MVGQALAPVGNGFLTGAITAETPLVADDFRSIVPRFSAGNRATDAVLVARIAEIVAGHGTTNAQIALARVLAQQP